jgi:nucleoside phosphorylase
MRSHKDYTIGWICALPLEMTAAKAMLDEIHADLPNPRTDNNTYTLGRIHGHNVVITCLPSGGYGTISATAIISHLKSTFPEVRYGLMVGIGGGVPSKDTDIRLGDVVVSHPTGTVGGVVQYDLGKTVSGGDSQRTGMLNQPHPILLTAIARLRSDRMMKNRNKISETVMETFDKHLDMKNRFSKPSGVGDRLFLPAYVHPDQEKTCARCDSKQLVQRNTRTSTEPQVYYGVIASGNQVIKDGQSRDRIAKEINALCFEMEAAGIMNQLPCLVVRGICDYCDSHKNKDWQGYAALTAAAFSKELLSVVPVSLTGEINRKPIIRFWAKAILIHS